MEYFGRAKTATEATKIANAREEIELAILEEVLRANSENDEFNYGNVWKELQKKDKDMSITENTTENNYTIVYKGYNFLIDNQIVTHIEDQTDPSQTTSELIPKGSVTIDGVTYEESYDIWNKAQLETFRNRVNAGETFENCILRQKANINLNSSDWEPIGSIADTKPFSGTFDAENKTIRGIYINSSKINRGLFGYVKNGTIKRLTVEGNVAGGSGSAGLVSLIENGKIESCTNKVLVSNTDVAVYWNSTFKNSIIIGGVCGIISGKSEILNSYNNGNVECNIKNCNTIIAGGIVGAINETSNNTNIENCSNSGEIKIASTIPNTGVATILGGIVGSIWEGKISKCSNTGRIYSIETSDITTYNVSGGITGSCFNVNNDSSKKIEKCWNSGEIENAIAGGMVGLCNYYTVENCYNTGKIKSNYKCGISASYSPCGGGICGISYGTISNCYNKGEIENNGCGFLASNTNCGIAAGIVGDNAKGGISNCYNKGTIKVLPNVEDQRGCTAGGIIGWNRSNVINVYNTGNIMTNENSKVCIGGIVSWEIVSNDTRDVNYVYNIGDLIGNAEYKGGVLGVHSSNYAKWSNFFWLENISATHAVGTATGEDPTKYTSDQIKNLISNKELPDTDWAIDSNINNGYPYLKVFDDINIWLRDSNINDGDPYLRENLPK